MQRNSALGIDADKNIDIGLTEGNALLVQLTGNCSFDGTVDFQSTIDGVNYTNTPYQESRSASPSKSAAQLSCISTLTEYILLPPMTQARIKIASVTTGDIDVRWREIRYPFDPSAAYSTDGNTWTADQRFNDNVKLFLGTVAGTDAELYYDGTNFFIVVNSGEVRLSGDLNFSGAFKITSTNGNNLEIEPTGNIVLKSTTTISDGLFQPDNIRFPSSQVASSNANTLDDYEEGTWTPVLTFATEGDLSVSYSNQFGAYNKMGRLVVVSFNVVTSSFTHTTASGQLRVLGLPFTSASGSDNRWANSLIWQGITKADYTHVTSRMLANTTGVRFTASGSGQDVDNVEAADMPSGGDVILQGTVVYWV